MSSQSGIGISPELAKEFPEFVSSDDVAAILAIDHAREHVDLEHRVAGSLSDIQERLGEGDKAKYIILRLPEAESFAFVQFMPDQAPLSSKMKYASSHATIHRQLGGSSTFATTIFWTDLAEVSEKGLRAHNAHEDAPAPMTEEEQSLATAKEFETAQGSRGRSVAGQSTLAINANVSEESKAAISDVKGSEKAAVFRVSSDESESIELVNTVETTELASQFRDLQEPRYVVADVKAKTAFAFVCPRSATIKQRMLFASTRISFLEYLKGLTEVDTQIETFDPESDLQFTKLVEEVSPDGGPSQNESLGSQRPKFQRPRPPKRR